MFDIALPELLLIAVVALLVLGPERLPKAMRTLGLWIGRARRSFDRIRAEIESEVGVDDLKRQVHNDIILEETRRLSADIQRQASAIQTGMQQKGTDAAPSSTGTSETVAPNSPSGGSTAPRES